MIVSPRYQLVDAFRHVSCAETTIEALSRATTATTYSLLSAEKAPRQTRSHVVGANIFRGGWFRKVRQLVERVERFVTHHNKDRPSVSLDRNARQYSREGRSPNEMNLWHSTLEIQGENQPEIIVRWVDTPHARVRRRALLA
jgi:hypothetical protein